MHKGKIVLFAVLVLLSLATGLTKLVQMPEEMELFRNAGFADFLTIVFGLIQVLGGILLIKKQTRPVGAAIMAVTFLVASIVVFIKGMVGFAVFSLLFIALAVFFWRRPELERF